MYLEQNVYQVIKQKRENVVQMEHGEIKKQEIVNLIIENNEYIYYGKT